MNGINHTDCHWMHWLSSLQNYFYVYNVSSEINFTFFFPKKSPIWALRGGGGCFFIRAVTATSHLEFGINGSFIINLVTHGNVHQAQQVCEVFAGKMLLFQYHTCFSKLRAGSLEIYTRFLSPVCNTGLTFVMGDGQPASASAQTQMTCKLNKFLNFLLLNFCVFNIFGTTSWVLVGRHPIVNE